MFKKYKWNIVFVVLLVSIIGFILFDIILYFNIQRYLFDQTFHEMQMKTQLAVKLLEAKNLYALSDNYAALNELTQELRDIVNSRVTIIDMEGNVLTDSDVEPQQVKQMDNHLHRPEVQAALKRGSGQSYRKSETINRQLFYTAFTINHEQEKIGFVRLAYYAQNFERSMQKIISIIIISNLIGLFILFWVALYSGSVVTFPILKIVSTARRISAGDLERTFPVRRRDEIGSLALILNQLTERLKIQIKQISDERTKLQDILTNLDIGIIVLDQQRDILHVNPEVGRILDLTPPDLKNKNVFETLRSEPLLNSINHVFQEGDKELGEFVYQSDTRKKFIRYLVTPFFLTEENMPGVLIQLHDISELKRLEAIRRDFVTNASHELKTPLTAIYGYAETLLEGAADAPQSRMKFIRKIRDQAQRLEFLVADLLKLSELEREQPLILKSAFIYPLLREIIAEFKEKSKQKNIEVKLKTPRNLKVKIDAEGIRTVFNNLIDNAIKYTPEEGTITIQTTELNGQQVQFEVIDTGIGIDPKYHDRIFQRFYRIDKARSRALGGTGLGLAIVKHIIEGHGSHICVESELGKGSRFCFRLNKG